MHRSPSPDYPGSETQVAWSDMEPSVLLPSLSGRVFSAAQEQIFRKTGQTGKTCYASVKAGAV